jgi:hypothetical protein
MFIAGGIAILTIETVALSVGVGRLGTFNAYELDVTKAEEGVTQVLTDPVNGYNGGRNPEAEKGRTFTCQAIVNDKQREVTAVIVDDDGTYEVDWPR